MENKKLKKLELKKQPIVNLSDSEASHVNGGGFPFWLIPASVALLNGLRGRYRLDAGATEQDYREAFEGTTGVSYDFYTYGMGH